MLLTIHNLPTNIQYAQIKELIINKCGLQEAILDNLQNEGNGMKVTVGVVEEEDAALLVRKINGLYFKGQQLYVVNKKQTKESEQPYRFLGSQPQHSAMPGAAPLQQENYQGFGYGPPMVPMPNQFGNYAAFQQQAFQTFQNSYMGYGEEQAPTPVPGFEVGFDGHAQQAYGQQAQGNPMPLMVPKPRSPSPLQQWPGEDRGRRGNERSRDRRRSGSRSRNEPVNQRYGQSQDKYENRGPRQNESSRGGHAPYDTNSRGGHTPFNRDSRGGQPSSNRDSRGGHASFNRGSRGGHTSFNSDSRGGQATFDNDQRDGDAPFNRNQLGGHFAFNLDSRGVQPPFDNDQRGGDAPFDRNQRGGDAPFDRNQRGGHASFNRDSRGGQVPFDNDQSGGAVPFNRNQRGDQAPFDRDQRGGHASFNRDSRGSHGADDRDSRGGDVPFGRNPRGGHASFEREKSDDHALFDRGSRGDHAPYNNDSRGDRAPINRGARGGHAQFNRGSRGGHASFNRGSRGGQASFNSDSRGGHASFNSDSRGGHASLNSDSRGGHASFNSDSRGGNASFNRDTRGGHAPNDRYSRGGHASNRGSRGGHTPDDRTTRGGSSQYNTDFRDDEKNKPAKKSRPRMNRKRPRFWDEIPDRYEEIPMEEDEPLELPHQPAKKFKAPLELSDAKLLHNSKLKGVGKVLFEMARNLNILDTFAAPNPVKAALRKVVTHRVSEVVERQTLTPDQIYDRYRKKYPGCDDKAFYNLLQQKVDQGIRIPNTKLEHAVNKTGLTTKQLKEAKWKEVEQKRIIPCMAPGSVPHFPKGDKKLFKQLKQQDKVDMTDLEPYDVGEVYKKVIEDELDKIGAILKNEFNNTETPLEETAYGNVDKETCIDQSKKLIFHHVSRRITNKGLKLVRVMSRPKPPRRPVLEKLCAKYNCVSLKKSVKSPFYTASFDSYDTIDMLCKMDPVDVGDGIFVYFKHMHIGPERKPKTTASAKFEEFGAMRRRYVNKLIVKSKVNLLDKNWQAQEKEEKEAKEAKEKETKDAKEKETKETKEQETKAVKENKETKAVKENKETKEVKEKTKTKEKKSAEEDVKNVQVNVAVTTIDDTENKADIKKLGDNHSFLHADFEVIDEVRGSDNDEVYKDGSKDAGVSEDWDVTGDDWDDITEGTAGDNNGDKYDQGNNDDNVGDNDDNIGDNVGDNHDNMGDNDDNIGENDDNMGDNDVDDEDFTADIDVADDVDWDNVNEEDLEDY